MEIILNDKAIDGQFASLELFEAYFKKEMLPVFECMEKQHIMLQKKTDTYSRRITDRITLEQYLRQANRTVATIMKQKLVQLAYHEPHWDLQGMQSRKDGNYDYPGKCEEPNCFTEAIERNCPLLSLQHKDYMAEVYRCSCDGEERQIANIDSQLRLYKLLLLWEAADIRYIFETYSFTKSVRFAVLSGRCYAKEALLENGLLPEDFWKIFSNIPRLIEDKRNGRKTHFWDNIEGEICEYRLTVSGNREFRLLFLWRDALVFLNGFIKKTPKTPAGEKKKARELAKNTGK